MTAAPVLSPRDRVDAFAALGLVLYLDDAGQLRARGPQLLLEAARPALRLHRPALLAYLRSTTPPTEVPS
mgnify:CR=1 FL=1